MHTFFWTLYTLPTLCFKYFNYFVMHQSWVKAERQRSCLIIISELRTTKKLLQTSWTCSMLPSYMRSPRARFLQERFAAYPTTEMRPAGKQWTHSLFSNILYRLPFMVPAASTHLAWDMAHNHFYSDADSRRSGCHSYPNQLTRGDPSGWASVSE